MFKEDTIAAIATGLTDAGIGIVRISGSKAVDVGNRLFRSPSGKSVLCDAKTHVLQYGFIVNEVEAESFADWKSCIIDEVMAVVMRAPRSFTGEDTVEIQCHGGVLVMKRILEEVLKCGARMAEPGEFTKRAFLNGRMDLSRAEAVMDVISSHNEYALASSINQLNGKLSKEIKSLRDSIIYEIAFIESALDDPEHISLDGYCKKLSEKLDRLTENIEKLLSTVRDGKWIKEGINTVIVGKPNVGKSSLLNLLLGEERAIVTKMAGTTRDILKERVILNNISLNIVDTAGIRYTEDAVEKIGVERAKQYAKDADLILYVVDSSEMLDESDREIFPLFADKKMIVLMNKSDLCAAVYEDDILKVFREFFPDSESPKVIRTSATEGAGLKEFEKTVREMFFHGEIRTNGETVITNIRHAEALREALSSLKLVRKSIDDGMSEDFYSIDLMSAYTFLGKIIGEEVDDDLVEEIFSKFCMGK